MTVGGIRWLSFGSPSGYGRASEMYMSGLRAAGIGVSWTPMGWPSSVWEASFGPVGDPDVDGAVHGDIVGRDVEHDAVVLHAPPYWHERLAEEARGRQLVAFTTYETDRLPDEWKDTLSHFDRVLVPSRFNAQVFAASGLSVPVEAVPHIAPHRAQARPPTPDDAGASPFVVYLIATWSTRKAVLDAVEAYIAAFNAADDVVLVIHTTPENFVTRARADVEGPPPGHEGSSWFALAKSLGGHRRGLPRIVMSTRPRTSAEIDDLHRRGSCFVLLSRGEGWGLGAFEAAAWGNPVVVTGWGASPEFLPEGYPYLVDYDMVPTTTDVPDALWRPRPGERWARARVDHAATLLRHLYEHRQEARAWGMRARAHVLEHFDSAAVTRRLLAALDADTRPEEAASGAGPPRHRGAHAPPGVELDRASWRIYRRPRLMTPRMPRKSEGLDANEVDDGLIVYDESTDRVHHLNPTAAVILELCDGTRTVPEIAGAVAETFGLDEVPEVDTTTCIEDLVAQGLVS